jgi:hypothetical protein
VHHLQDGKILPLRFREEDEPAVDLSKWKMNVRLTCETRGGGEGLYYTFMHGADRLDLLLRSPYEVDWEDRWRENKYRVPVEVLFDDTPDGLIWPRIIWPLAGVKLAVDELHRVSQGACMEAGIQGVRYICSIGDRILQLFLDGLYWVVSRAELEYILAGTMGKGEAFAPPFPKP